MLLLKLNSLAMLNLEKLLLVQEHSLAETMRWLKRIILEFKGLRKSFSITSISSLLFIR